MGNVILTPGQESLHVDTDFKSDVMYIREPKKYYVLIPVKGIETMTKTVMVN